KPFRPCPSGKYEWDGACLMRRADYERLRTVSEYVAMHTEADDAVIVFPYENIYADEARRRVAGNVLQNYIVAGNSLTTLQLQGFERDRPNIGIYSADTISSWGIDGVPNLTRTPDLWLYLQRHYHSETEI